ncbi:DUF4097 family beta strand repeat-containing protein [Priestia koreensis]|uniref:DUF4097 family beta strand repeat-containing protein n=1 Tax=Priestia koreensis TaxID=284581 RepID=UPI001F59FDFC|nr:DUF4097 domain-containing protein [Priestia koreensis]MCM3004537.1 DUF4097 family beta strand repeat-containing protein [Priestia koreensis]UNL84749.1 DUF4097 domain-containing protein [Priestia koreensis]
MDKKKQILQMVEDGKLSVDEALVLLNSLENESSPGQQVSNSKDVSTVVLDKEPKAFYKEKVAAPPLKEKLMGFVNQTLKKVKDVDLDFNFGPSVDVQHIFQHAEAYLSELDIDVANGSVTLIPWQSQDVRIECEAKVYKATSQDEARKMFLQDVVFSIENGKLRFTIQKKQMKVAAKIYVPEFTYDRIKVRMFNGPIEGAKLMVKDLKAKTANGGVTFSELKGESVELETANGHILLKDSYMLKCEAETINGSIDIAGDYERTDIQTFNGSIKYHLSGDRGKKAYFKSTTGSIDVIIPDSLDLEGTLRSNLGNFNCLVENLEILDEKSETVQKSLQFKTHLGSSSPMKIVAESKTGSITLKPSKG